jgi:hypothetical protein
MARSVSPNLGWVVLSEADRAAAERRLAASATEGTRDELGFGTIHFAYADRFFPGTSVQQTRIRYIWFICWAYEELRRSRRSEVFSNEALREIEIRTGKKLLRSFENPNRSGIIGWTRFRVGAEPVLMPSAIYWNALKLWGMVRPRENTGQPPGQAELQARWREWTSESKRHHELSQEKLDPIFVDLPPTPDGWARGDSELTFDLTPQEAQLIKHGWKYAVEAEGLQESLMSKLAHAGNTPNLMWTRRVFDLGSAEDKLALGRAQKAASLVCIGRALYAAMIEELKNQDVRDCVKSEIHRDYLERLRLEHSPRALSLDLNELRLDVPKLSKQLFDLLQIIQEWSQQGGSFDRLKPIFFEREFSLKDTRAMLAPAAFRRRETWTVSEPAQPLNYRWPVVRTFLQDLSA